MTEAFVLGLISASAIAIITQVIAYYFSKRSLESQQEHSLKVMKMQLFHEDRKKALIKLDGLLKEHYKTFSVFRKTIGEYLSSSESIFIPLSLRKKLTKEMTDIDSFMTERQLEIQGLTWGDIEAAFHDDSEGWEEAFPEKALDNEVRNRLRGLKGSMRDKIKEYVAEEQ